MAVLIMIVAVLVTVKQVADCTSMASAASVDEEGADSVCCCWLMLMLFLLLLNYCRYWVIRYPSTRPGSLSGTRWVVSK